MTDDTKKMLYRCKKLPVNKDSKASLEIVSDSAAIIIYDGVRDEQGEISDWIVRDVNEAALREMGLPVDGLVNKLATELVATGLPLISNIELFREVTGMAKTYRFELHFPWNGKYFLMSIFPLGDRTLVITAQEVTESKQAERFENSLRNIMTLLNSTLDFEKIMENILSEAAQAMGTDMATITLIENERWVTQYGYGVPRDMIGRTLEAEEARGAENARRAKRPVIINDTAIDIRNNPKKAKEFNFGSFVIYPLIRKEEVIGTINFIDTSPRSFSDAQLDFVEKLSFPLSLTMGNARLFASMQREIAEHKRAGDVWCESGRLMGAVLQQMPAGVIIAEAPSGRMIMSNHQVERIWRQPFLESANIGEYGIYFKGFHEDGRAYDSGEWPLARSLTKGETVIEEEISLLRGDGTKGTMLVSSTPVKDDVGQIIASVMIFYSITERKQLEKALWETVLEAEQRANELDAVIAAIPDGLIIHDKNGKIKFMNGFARNTLVRSDNSLELPLPERNRLVEFTTAQGKPLMPGETPTDRVLNGEIIQNLELVINKDPEHPIQVSVTCAPIRGRNGEITGTVTTFIDITKRKRIEEENRSLAKFPSENPKPVLRLNRKGIILYANEASGALLQMWNCTIGSVVPEYMVQKIAETFAHSSEITIDIECNKQIYLLTFVPVKELNYVNIYGSDITECKRVEEELRESQTLLKSIIDSSPNSIFIKDQQSRIVMANPATLAVIGKPIEQVIGKDDCEHYDVPEIGLAIMENDRRIMQSRQTETIEETVWIAGKKRIFLATKTPWRDAEGQVIGVLGISQDITERKEMEENLKLLLKSSRQHISEIDAMLEAIPHAVYFGNVDGITRCNDEALSLLEASSLQDFQQQIGELGAKFRVRYQRNGSLVAPENLPFNRALKGEVINLDTWVTKSDSGEDVLIRGNAAPVIIDGRIFGAVAIDIDITDQYRIQQALRESEEKMRAIFEQAGVGINQVSLDGRYIQANHKFQVMTGYTKDELLNLTIYELYHPDDRKMDEEYMSKLIAGELSTYTEVMRLIRKDESVLWTNLTVSLVRSGSEPAYFIRIVEDFSERKQMEQELQAKQEELLSFNEELQAQQEELTSANEELQAQQEELTTANEELQAQQEELMLVNQELQAQTDLLNAAFQELQRQSEQIQEHGEAEARARDLAERRVAELDATISSIAAGIIIYDDLGNIFRMNQFARNLLPAFNDDQIPYMERGMGLGLCKPDGTSYEVEEMPLKRALQGEIIREEELMIEKMPGKSIWLSGTLAPIRSHSQTIIGVIFVFTDITERKRKTEDLLASEREMLKVTLNSLGEGVVAIDPDERIMLINQAAVNLTGYSENEVIGEPFHKIFYVLDDKTSEPFEVNVSQKTSGNLILVTRDLREVPVAMNSSPIKALDGRIIGRVTIFQDISEKQKIDRELLKADKLESLGILAGGIAHDFNNILAAILSNIQLALRKLEKNEDIKKYLFNTVETTRKASDLTKQLLTFSRGGSSG